jgi:hypothetical protein
MTARKQKDPKALVKGGRRNIRLLVAQEGVADIQFLARELERDKGGKY